MKKTQFMKSGHGYKLYRNYIEETDNLIENLSKDIYSSSSGSFSKDKLSRDSSYETIEYYTYTDSEDNNRSQQSNQKGAKSENGSNGTNGSSITLRKKATSRKSSVNGKSRQSSIRPNSRFANIKGKPVESLEEEEYSSEVKNSPKSTKSNTNSQKSINRNSNFSPASQKSQQKRNNRTQSVQSQSTATKRTKNARNSSRLSISSSASSFYSQSENQNQMLTLKRNRNSSDYSYYSSSHRSQSVSSRSRSSMQKSKSDGLDGYRRTLSKMDTDYLDKKRQMYIQKWKEEDERAAKEEQEYIDGMLFRQSPNKYKIRGIKRQHIEKYEPYDDNPEYFYEKPPIELPPNPSQKFMEEYNKTYQERLCVPKHKEEPKKKTFKISKQQFDDFMNRNAELENLKRNYDNPKRPREKRIDTKPVVERLYKESLQREIYEDYVPQKPQTDESDDENSNKANAVWTNDPSWWQPKQQVIVDNGSEKKQTQSSLMSKKSMMMTKKAPSFFDRTNYSYADVINDYRKFVEEKQTRDIYQEQMEYV